MRFKIIPPIKILYRNKAVTSKGSSFIRLFLAIGFLFLVFYFAYWQEILLLSIAPPDTPPVKMKMVISAYYKPVPKQKFYYTGSYWRDLMLNGSGITFSGKAIQKGYAAADLKYYPLGTRFFVPGLGEVVVEDKGESIKGPHRLDIFVGEGEEGLLKSIDWGKQEIYVEVIAKG